MPGTGLGRQRGSSPSGATGLPVSPGRPPLRPDPTRSRWGRLPSGGCPPRERGVRRPWPPDPGGAAPVPSPPDPHAPHAPRVRRAGPGAGEDGGWVFLGERFGRIWIRGLGHHPAPIARVAPGRWAGVLCTSARTATNRRAQASSWFTSPWGRGPWAYPRDPLGALWRLRSGPPVLGRGDPPADAPARRRFPAPPPRFPPSGPKGPEGGARRVTVRARGRGPGGRCPAGARGRGGSPLPCGGAGRPVSGPPPAGPRSPLRKGRGSGSRSGRPRGGVSPRPGAGGAGAWVSTSGGRAWPALPVPPPGGGPRLRSFCGVLRDLCGGPGGRGAGAIGGFTRYPRGLPRGLRGAGASSPGPRLP